MLTKIEISNINAIKKCEISFNKSKYQYRNEMILKNDYVNPIAFYGTNGSGKSSLLKAISQFIALLIDEPHQLSPFIPNFTAVLDKKNVTSKSIDMKSHIKFNFLLNDKNYSYKIQTSTNSKITHEVLTENENIIFERKAATYVYRDATMKVTAPMFPVLRTLDLEKNDATIKEVYQFLSNISFIDASNRTYQFKISKQKSYKDIIVEHSAEIKNILSTYNEFPIYDILSLPNKLGKNEYFVNIKLNDGRNLTLPYELMSSGMENQSVILSTLLSMPPNGVLLIDEIENALHPLTLLDFLNVVQKKNIQLIFSSHNTFILQKLRPDQIFFANWKNGYSNYKRLSEIYPNIREINNIEKMYLSCLFDEDIKKDG